MFKRLQSFLPAHHRAIFYGSWLLLQLLQGGLTELFDDEAYYWVYAQFPAWGYFDHPPMIAMLIKAGYAMFQHEFGVRFLSILLNTGALMLIESLTFKKNAPLFYAICFSLAIAQLGGMLAVPDTPLMFFVALFFIVYRRFDGNASIINALLLGLSIALMLYTKYHAVLIVLFTAMSNIRLFKQSRAWLALLFAALLFAPHVYWQYQHDFPSVRFHLFERNADTYRLGFTLSFLLGQLLITGPLAGWLLITAALKHHPASATERALRYSFAGIFLFFLVCTLKGKAEANWTIPAFVGLIVLAHQYLAIHPTWRRVLYLSASATFVLVSLTRILMVADLPPSWRLPKDEIHGNRVWVKEIEQKASGLPVVFINSYQRPSKYMFYSGQPAMSLNTPYYRRNNFNFWPLEDEFNGSPAYVVGGQQHPWLTDSLPGDRLAENAGRRVPQYFSFSSIMIDRVQADIAGKALTLRFRVRAPGYTRGRSTINSQETIAEDTASLSVAILTGKKITAYLPSRLKLGTILHSRQPRTTATFDLRHLAPGRYTAMLVISSVVPDMPSINSSAFELTVE